MASSASKPQKKASPRRQHNGGSGKKSKKSKSSNRQKSPASKPAWEPCPVGARAVTLEFLLEWTWTHDAWTTPTCILVRDLIIPATAKTGGPYTDLLPSNSVGRGSLFISHAWSNPFGLLVAAARKYVSTSKFPKGRPVFIWVDIFAITQKRGEAQQKELAQLEPTIADPACTTLLVLDTAARPLSRCWCIFEIYATLYHAVRFGKLQVRAGTVTSSGVFKPCSDREQLCKIALTVDAMKAEATVAADKVMILSRLESLASDDRKGIREFNRKLQRAVRHGW